MKNLNEAMIKVMEEVKNIDKAMTVGSGNHSYKGVADKDVKLAIGQAMSKNGLTCVPVEINPTIRVDRWEETNNYGTKQKQSVFTEVLAKYRITHSESGEHIEIVGYGHGVDSMDKSAGKATTYALKNALLYTFLVPTGSIDDTDATHSTEHQTPQQPKKAQPKKKKTLSDDRVLKAVEAVNDGKTTLEAIQKEYDLTPEQLKQFES